MHTLDRLGLTVRDTLNMVHGLKERGVGVRTLADPLAIDTAEPDSPMAQLAFVMLALFGQMERTYAAERASHARAVPTANGRRTGRPSVVDPAKLEHAAPCSGPTVPPSGDNRQDRPETHDVVPTHAVAL
ncbi:recombinase family protein [Arthrobacter sp. NPDC093128]|uniref:recombinase family protein n=1 Tax=Arthrobacter sp. NPDC093128 TaxID=3154979 RepID=UPI003434F1A0